MNSEQVLQKAESLAKKELSLLQEEEYGRALQLSEKRKVLFSQLENRDLTLVTGIKDRLYRLQEIQGILSQEARRLHKMLQKELETEEHNQQKNSNYHNAAIVTPLKNLRLSTIV